jgi:hypothetical protein
VRAVALASPANALTRDASQRANARSLGCTPCHRIDQFPIPARWGQGADYLKAIKAYAATTNNSGVYALAQIAPSKAPTPTPTPPPAVPTDLVASLENLGAIRVSWTASIARGKAFSLWRKLNISGQSFEQIATVSGTTTFVDETLPAGAGGSAGAGVLYAVKAHRLDEASPFSEPVLIRFGSVDGSAGGEQGLKIAA